ncbi:MAG TPA: sulfite exporter TauE/SafE family protein, partial [bacterium]
MSSTTEPSAPTTAMSQGTLAKTLAVGFGAGLVNGLVGIGGGILIVPGLILVRRLPPQTAVSTSLASVMVLSTLALGFHLWWSGLHMDPAGIALLLLAGIVAAQIGTMLLKSISTRWLLIAFSGMTIVSSVNLFAMGLHLMPPLVKGVAEPPLWSYPFFGIISGFFSGLLGVGGGGLVALFFSVVFHTPILGGLPVALAVNIANGAAGVATSWRSGRILWREVGYMTPTAVLGIVVGTASAIWLPPDALRVI